VLFICDEYHAFATVGENDPSGDEKFFALSRQARCIPIVATQSISSLRSNLPGESWRTLLQTFRTKIFLALSDDFSAETASRLCGKEEQLKLHYSFSESGQDAGVSVLTGRAAAARATVSTSKGR
jgi:type IV secretory pathway TraG/TraD family ATPase VirD4